MSTKRDQGKERSILVRRGGRVFESLGVIKMSEKMGREN